MQGNASVAQGLRIIGPQRDDLVEARQCLLVPLQRLQRAATIVQGHHIIGPERQCLAVAGQRLGNPSQLLQRNATVEEINWVPFVSPYSLTYQFDCQVGAPKLSRNDT